MTTITRQNTLFVAESWLRVYEALQNVNFRAYDQETLVQALIEYVRVNYPDEFNDTIASSEFITKVEVLAWLSQNLSFRVDMNSRENFLPTAERRESILRLANTIAYKVNRVRGARALVKITSAMTTQNLTDTSGTSLQNRTVEWLDPRNPDWFEQFITIINAAMTVRTRYGRPIASYLSDGVRFDQYVFNSYAPTNGVYSTTAIVGGQAIDFEVHNFSLDETLRMINEVAPSPMNAMNLMYRNDGFGFNSIGTGFMLPIKQGKLQYQDITIAQPIPNNSFILDIPNVSNDDVWVQKINPDGTVAENWTVVENVYGEGVGHNTTGEDRGVDPLKIFEVDTLMEDRVRVRFGDGAFGEMPVGNYRIWYRVCNPIPTVITQNSLLNQTMTLPYVANNEVHYLTLSYSMQEVITNGGFSESNSDIKMRANKVFYTQNRMVTGQDYQNFFLRDSTVEKVRTVNRTYVGHSRYAKLTDPTSLYEGVNHMGEDGRIYQIPTRNEKLVEGNPAVLTAPSLISQHLRPIFRQEDKKFLYYNYFNEIPLPVGQYFWRRDVEVSGFSRGRVFDRNTNLAVTVGANATAGNPLWYIRTDSIFRFDDMIGETAAIDRVIENGSAVSGVWLRDDVVDGTPIYSVQPALRTELTEAEARQIQFYIGTKLNFAIRWDQATLTWKIVTFENIDRTSDFSVENAGDVSGTGQDASWLILMDYIAGEGDDPQWRIIDRGLSLAFESAREVDFIFMNNQTVINPETAHPARDEIIIMDNNESRDSKNRLGFVDDEVNCGSTFIDFVGDGETVDFPIGFSNVNPTEIIVYVNDVLQIRNYDYELVTSVNGDIVRFYVPPTNMANILIRIGGNQREGVMMGARIVGDSTTVEFIISGQIVQSSNSFIFWDGVSQGYLNDYWIEWDGANSRIVFTTAPPTGVIGNLYFLTGVEERVFSYRRFISSPPVSGNQVFGVLTESALLANPLVTVDGVVQHTDEYTVTMNGTTMEVRFVGTDPGAGAVVRIIVPKSPLKSRSGQYGFATDGITSIYTLADFRALRPEQVVVSLDGVAQLGPWHPSPDFVIINNNQISFLVPPVAGLQLSVYVFLGAVGYNCIDPGGVIDVDFDDDSVPSCNKRFLRYPISLTPSDVLRHSDGYTNVDGLLVLPLDSDRDGVYDDPYAFRNFVKADGVTDLVLWRSVTRYGFNVWEPINRNTNPRGTYGIGNRTNLAVPQVNDPMNGGKPMLGDSWTVLVTNPEDVHYDPQRDIWLRADSETQTWVQANSVLYRKEVGRDYVKFNWKHYSTETTRIDPSQSNVMNAYILTKGYYQSYLDWINGGLSGQTPVVETAEQLRLQYSFVERYKTQSDSIIFYPARFKALFGDTAVRELQATFKVIKTRGSTLSDNDLVIQLLKAIQEYFDVRNWEFGETFYFTELSTYLHQRLAPNLQSVVVVPKDGALSFGNIFQVRSEPDELFISTAQPKDVVVVENFSLDELRILNATNGRAPNV